MMRVNWSVAVRTTAVVVSLALSLGALAAPARAQGSIANPGFEEGQPGGPPASWKPGSASYNVELVQLGPHGGKQAVRITGLTAVAGQFGNVMQWIDAAPYRGQRIRFSGWVRAEPASSPGAMLWLRVDRSGGQPGFFDNMMDRPIAAREWKRYSIVGTVAPDAQKIFLGMMLQGTGQAWLDDVALEVLPPGPAAEPARALSERGLANLVAFSRLLGYVRFFHPSDEAAASDWNAFAVAGVRPVEAAASAGRLAAVLDSLFLPVAPSLVVSVGGSGKTRTPAAPPTGAQQVVSWRHLGAGLSTRAGYSAYRSERIRTPLGGPLPDSIPDPLKPFAADLGGGVSVLVPLAVYADSAGTLPRPRVRAGTAAEDALPASAYDANDRAVRLADVALAWNVFQYFYPYFDVAGTDWNAELPRALRAAATDADAPAFALTLKRMVVALKDGHGRVSGPGDELRSRTAPVLLTEAEGKVVVLRVDTAAPGARMGDIVLAVDGVPVADALARDEALISGATPQWRRWRAVSELLLGPAGSSVRLDVVHPNGERATLTVARKSYLGQLDEVRPEPVSEVRPGIWYVDLGRATDAQFAAAVPQLQGARGIVFDMRGYPRLNTPAVLAHLSRTPMTSAQWHIPVVTRPDRPAMRFQRGGEWNVQPLTPYFAAPRIFLLDGRAISYAESTMGIVENYRLGEILGETSAGTNGNINPMALPGRYSITWTGMKVLKHDGSRHHGVGIAPTVTATRTVAGVTAGRDELLERAVGLLDH